MRFLASCFVVLLSFADLKRAGRRVVRRISGGIAGVALLGSLAFAQGQVSFLQTLNFPANSFWLASADFNRDGKLDIATPGQVFLGNGDGTFQPPRNLNLTGTLSLVVAADFNGDGNPDLLIQSYPNFGGPVSQNVLLGNGDGTFQPAKSFSVGTGFTATAVADVNGDGKPDLLGVDGNFLFVLLGKGDGTFQPVVTYPAGTSPFNLVTGDLNGDGKLDVAITQNSNTATNIEVLLGNGDGTFQAPMSSPGLAGGLGSLVAGDVNGDSKLDLVIIGASSTGAQGQIYSFLGNGDGTFQAPIVAAPVNGNIGLTDLNGDGKLDLVVYSPCGVSLDCFVGTELYLGNEDGTFTYVRSYAVESGSSPFSNILIADFNNDGKLDLAMGNTILLSSGNARFNSEPAAPLPNGATSAVPGDFNGDGNPDLAVTSFADSDEVDILLGDGTGALSLAHTYPLTIGEGFSITTGDMNNDGKLDLVFAAFDRFTNTYTLNVMFGNGDGTFGTPMTYPLSNGPVALGMADLKGDHKPYVATIPTQSDSLVLWPNNGDGTLGTPVSYFAGGSDNSVTFADFNGDGKLDAAVASFSGVGILLGNGDGTLQPVSFLQNVTGGTTCIIAADFNNDGKPDLVAGKVLLGNGDSTFTPIGPNLPCVRQVSDLNRDGNLDLVSTDVNTGLTVNLGNGDGTFGSSISVESSRGIDLVQVADFNQDHLPDIAWDFAPGSGYLGTMFVLLNTTGPAPGVELSPSALDFGSQAIGTSSMPMPIALKNTGKGVLNVTSVTITGANASEFGQTNNCTTVQPGGKCTINVTFTPTAAGVAGAAVKITDNAGGGTQMVALSGTGVAGPDFAIAPASGTKTSQTVNPGQSATFNLVITPSGSFTGTVNLGCSISPTVNPAPSCNLPASVNVTSGNPAPFAVTVATVAPMAASTISPGRFPSGPGSLVWSVLFASGLLMMRRVRRRSPLAVAPIVALTMVWLVGCGGGGTSSHPSSGTPAGTYTATVTATSGSLHHSETLTVIVQ